MFHLDVVSQVEDSTKISLWHAEGYQLRPKSRTHLSILFAFRLLSEGQPKSPQEGLMVLARRMGQAIIRNFGSEKNFVTPHA